MQKLISLVFNKFDDQVKTSFKNAIEDYFKQGEAEYQEEQIIGQYIYNIKADKHYQFQINNEDQYPKIQNYFEEIQGKLKQVKNKDIFQFPLQYQTIELQNIEYTVCCYQLHKTLEDHMKLKKYLDYNEILNLILECLNILNIMFKNDINHLNINQKSIIVISDKVSITDFQTYEQFIERKDISDNIQQKIKLLNQRYPNKNTQNLNINIKDQVDLEGMADVILRILKELGSKSNYDQSYIRYYFIVYPINKIDFQMIIDHFTKIQNIFSQNNRDIINNIEQFKQQQQSQQIICSFLEDKRILLTNDISQDNYCIIIRGEQQKSFDTFEEIYFIIDYKQLCFEKLQRKGIQYLESYIQIKKQINQQRLKIFLQQKDKLSYNEIVQLFLKIIEQYQKFIKINRPHNIKLENILINDEYQIRFTESANELFCQEYKSNTSKEQIQKFQETQQFNNSAQIDINNIGKIFCNILNSHMKGFKKQNELDFIIKYLEEQEVQEKQVENVIKFFINHYEKIQNRYNDLIKKQLSSSQINGKMIEYKLKEIKQFLCENYIDCQKFQCLIFELKNEKNKIGLIEAVDFTYEKEFLKLNILWIQKQNTAKRLLGQIDDLQKQDLVNIEILNFDQDNILINFPSVPFEINLGLMDRNKSILIRIFTLMEQILDYFIKIKIINPQIFKINADCFKDIGCGDLIVNNMIQINDLYFNDNNDVHIKQDLTNKQESTNFQNYFQIFSNLLKQQLIKDSSDYQILKKVNEFFISNYFRENELKNDIQYIKYLLSITKQLSILNVNSKFDLVNVLKNNEELLQNYLFKKIRLMSNIQIDIFDENALILKDDNTKDLQFIITNSEFTNIQQFEEKFIITQKQNVLKQKIIFQKTSINSLYGFINLAQIQKYKEDIEKSISDIINSCLNLLNELNDRKIILYTFKDEYLSIIQQNNQLCMVYFQPKNVQEYFKYLSQKDESYKNSIYISKEIKDLIEMNIQNSQSDSQENSDQNQNITQRNNIYIFGVIILKYLFISEENIKKMINQKINCKEIIKNDQELLQFILNYMILQIDPNIDSQTLQQKFRQQNFFKESQTEAKENQNQNSIMQFLQFKNQIKLFIQIPTIFIQQLSHLNIQKLIQK